MNHVLRGQGGAFLAALIVMLVPGELTRVGVSPGPITVLAWICIDGGNTPVKAYVPQAPTLAA